MTDPMFNTGLQEVQFNDAFAQAAAPAPSPYGLRQDGTAKSTGFFGPLPHASGKISTEISADSEVDGKPLLYPLLVPTMPRAHIDFLLGGGKPTKEMNDIAIEHAIGRVKAGKSPFWGEGDPLSPLPDLVPTP